MLNAYLFDQRQGKKITEWRDALQGLSEHQMLWLDLLDASDDEAREVTDALAFEPGLLGNAREAPALDQRDDHLVVTAVGLVEAEDGSAPQTAAITCFVGKNWVLTSHAVELSVIEEFAERAEGQGEIGKLDAPTFLVALLEFVVTSYRRAFDRIEMDLEEFDVQALRSAGADTEHQIGVLVEVRRQVGALRRSLLPPSRHLRDAQPARIRPRVDGGIGTKVR